MAATLSTAVESVKDTNFQIKRDADNTIIPIKSVALDDAKTGVTIETYIDMKDAKDYTVTYTADDENKTTSTAAFTATNDTVTKLELTTLNVTANVEDDSVKVKTISANDVILNTYTFTEASAKNINVTVTPVGNGYVNGNKIFLPAVGDSAKVKVEYHTYKYDTEGKETGAVTEEFVVTAVADNTTVGTFNYTITNGTDKVAWKSAGLKINKEVCIGDTAYAHFNIVNSKGTDVTEKYKVSSSDSNILVVNETSLETNKYAQIAGAKAGMAYIIVKDKDNNVVQTLPVTVKAKRAFDRLELSSQAINVSNAVSASGVKVKLIARDQYNTKINVSNVDCKVEALDVPSGINKSTAAASLGAIKLNGEETETEIKGSTLATKGTYVFKITAKIDGVEKSNTLTVVVSEPNGSVTYDVELSATEMDMNVDANNKTAKTLDIKVVKKKGGVAYDYVSVNSFSAVVSKSDSTLYVVSDGATAWKASVVSGVATSGLTKEAKVGSYAVKVELKTSDKETLTITKNFNVKDTQQNVGLVINNTSDSISDTDIKNVLKSKKDVVTYSYDGSEVTVGDDDIVKVYGVAVGKTATVYSVDVKIQVAENVKVVVNVPVNRSFTSTVEWNAGGLSK